MQLLVTTLTDDTIRLDVNASATIDLVKCMIQTITGTPVDQIRLVCGNDELPDGTTTLEELHIEHLSRIIMREPTRLSRTEDTSGAARSQAPLGPRRRRCNSWSQR